MAQTVIGVRFKKAGKIHFFDPGDDEIVVGDSVIVDTIRGLECGTVVIAPREMPEPEEPSPMKPETRKIHRKATRADMARVALNKENEKKAFEICLQKIKDHDLPMKLINVSYTFDVNKIIFYFTADGRVDCIGFSYANRTSASRRSRRGKTFGRHRLLRSSSLLRDFFG